MPAIRLGGDYRIPITLAESFPAIQFKVNFAFISIGFFTNLNILFSIWVFFLLATVQHGIMARIGVPKTAEIVTAQHLGGFFMYTLFGLWMARRHLYDVVRKAIGRGQDIDDSGGILLVPDRHGGRGVRRDLHVLLPDQHGHVPWPRRPRCWPRACCCSSGSPRVVAEAGLINLDLPYNAHEFTVFSFGSANLHRADLTILTLSQTFSRNWRTLGMCAMAHVNKMGDEVGGARRGIFPVIVSALVMAAVISVVYTVFLG